MTCLSVSEITSATTAYRAATRGPFPPPMICKAGANTMARSGIWRSKRRTAIAHPKERISPTVARRMTNLRPTL